MKHVVITGADRGIGFALAEIYVKNGYTVYAGQFMPDWPQLSNLKAEFPDRLYIIPLNVGDDASVKNAARMVGEITNRVDVLINCAGIFPPADDRAHFNSTFQVNALGALRMVDCFLPLMQEGDKRLCTVSSEAGIIALCSREDRFVYCSSKAALNISMQMLFNKLRPEGFTFRMYHPGWVRSYMHGQKATEGNFEPEEAAQIAYEQFIGDTVSEDVLLMQDVYNQYWPF